MIDCTLIFCVCMTHMHFHSSFVPYSVMLSVLYLYYIYCSGSQMMKFFNSHQIKVQLQLLMMQ